LDRDNTELDQNLAILGTILNKKTLSVFSLRSSLTDAPISAGIKGK